MLRFAIYQANLMVMVVAISVAVFVKVAMMFVAKLVSRFGFNGYTVDAKFVQSRFCVVLNLDGVVAYYCVQARANGVLVDSPNVDMVNAGYPVDFLQRLANAVHGNSPWRFN